MNGPIQDAWIEPWKQYLEKNGVKFVLQAEGTSFSFNQTEITAFNYTLNGKSYSDTADAYIMSVPIDRAVRIWALNSSLSVANLL